MNKILVLIKANNEISPFDEAALEIALRMENSFVEVLSMGPLSSLSRIESLTRLGVKATLVSDVAYIGSDTIATSKILANAIKLIKPDMIFAGKNSLDGDTGQVPAMLSELLGFDFVSPIMEVLSNKFILRDGKEGIFRKNTIYSFERVASLRFPRIASSIKEVKIINNNDLGLAHNEIGFNGSPTCVLKTYQSNSSRRFVKWINKEDFFKLLKDNSIKNTEQIDEEIKKAKLIYYVGNIKNIAEKYGILAKELKIKELNDFINSIPKDAKIILFESNVKLKEFASRIAIRLGYGLTADCTSFRNENDRFIMTRPAMAGNIMAEIISKSPISLATVSKKEKSSSIIFGIGKGAIPYLNQIKQLALKYGAEIVTTRDVVDAQILPYPYQVGLTGRIVAPKIYVSFGISGAIQHIVGIESSDTIISINTDNKAPIFDYSDYGLHLDIKEILC